MLKITKEEIGFDSKFIQVLLKNLEIDGQYYRYEVVERKTYGNVVSIFAVTKNGEVILEKIFRHPINAYMIELPAGLMDKSEETETEAVTRELAEETGFTFQGVPQHIITSPPSAGLVNDEISYFFVDGAEKTLEPKREAIEDITVIKVPISKVINFILHPPEGCKIDIKILGLITALHTMGLIKSFR